MKYIPLTQGKYAIVDNKDYGVLNEYTWYAHKGRKTFYARSSKGQYMHRFILEVKERYIEVDHKNGNGLDNRRKNLRKTTRQQNSWNNGGYGKTASGYKGVYKCSSCKNFVVRIKYKNKSLYLGHYSTAKEAALAYNEAVVILRGEFAKLNKI
jgi:hypothetical protein